VLAVHRQDRGQILEREDPEAADLKKKRGRPVVIPLETR
jgi:hypothetical protein